MELESLLENADLRQLDDRWRGEHVRARGFPIESEDEEPQDYRTTFKFPQRSLLFDPYKICAIEPIITSKLKLYGVPDSHGERSNNM